MLRSAPAVLVLACAANAQPVSTAFTYQGELAEAGAPVSGVRDLQFRLFTASSGGLPVGSTLCADDVAVSGGRFVVQLDFGAVFGGQQRFLEIAARVDPSLPCSTAQGYVVLSPRQPLTLSPYAAYALNAGTASNAANASQLNGQAASFYQNAANMTAGTLPDARLAGTYSGALALSNAANVLAGNGAGLTQLNAANIASGTLPDARLAGTYSGALALSNAANVLAGNGAGLTQLNAANLASGTIPAARLPNPLSVIGANATQASVFGQNDSNAAQSTGVFGLASATTGGTNGVRGDAVSPDGVGVLGYNGGTGGFTTGVLGVANAPFGRGVVGWNTFTGGDAYGVYGRSEGATGRGVFGEAVMSSSAGPTYGVFGLSHSFVAGSAGVRGENTNNNGIGVSGRGCAYGGFFETSCGPVGAVAVYGRVASSGLAIPSAKAAIIGESSITDGIIGLSNGFSGVTGMSDSGNGVVATSNSNIALYAESQSTAFGAAAIRGRNDRPGNVIGIEGISQGSLGTGIAGRGGANGGYFEGATAVYAVGANTALYAQANQYAVNAVSNSTAVRGYGFYGGDFHGSGVGVHASTNGNGDGSWSVFCDTSFACNGTKSFVIDHPLDPANKSLIHYCPESPEPLLQYQGNAVLDADGAAWVTLPDYFDAINRDFRYQLTPIGAAMPFLHVAHEVEHNRFEIAGGVGGAKVSWTVTGVRNDAWARAHPARVEVDKPEDQRGRYYHPEFVGEPDEKSIFPRPERAPAPPRNSN